MSIVLFSCEDKGLDNQDWLQEPNFANPLTLTLSSKELVLVKENEAQNAITFTWTQGNDRGAGTSLKYFFRIDILGNNFSKDEFEEDKKTVYTEEIPAGVLTRTYTVKQLNSILLKHFKRPGGTVTNLEVQIIAQVNGGAEFQLPEVSTSSFAVTNYSPGPLPLFMVGDAISGSWDYSTGKSLPEITERTTYNFIGDFSVGSFKVIEEPGHELPTYDPVYTVGKENTIVYNETEERTTANVFKVTQAGRHYFNMDIEAGTYEFYYKPYDKLTLVGESIDGQRWNKDNNPRPMNWDSKTPEVFTTKVNLGLGEMKIFVNTPDWNSCLRPLVANTPINGNNSDATGFKHALGGPDDKWVIATAGDYDVTINTVKMTIVFKKL